MVLGCVATFVIFFVAIAITAWPYSRTASAQIFVVALLVFPVILALPAVVARLKARRQWRRRSGIFSETESTVSEDGVTTRIKSLGISSSCSWDAFTGFRRSERVVVLYLKAGTYMIVSRAKFPLARDWEAFLQVLGDKLKQR